MDANWSIAILLLSILMLSWTFIYLVLHWVAIICGKIKLHSKRKLPPLAVEVQGVSIVKPLCGFDPHLEENLESFFKLDYPKFELLLCVGEPSDGPSLPIIKKLKQKYPHVDVKVFEGGENVGPNPKINNMLPGYRNAQYPLLWFSDSSIFTPPDNLKEMTSHLLNPKVAAVHQLPFVGSVQGFAGYLDKVYFGTQHSRMYLLSYILKQNCINGMAWVLKRQILEEAGGLPAFSDYLAEDYFMAQALLDRGWKFALSGKPAIQNPGVRSAKAYRNRVTRWTKLRATMVPIPGLLEPFTECFFLALFGGLSLHYLIGTNFFVFFLLYVAVWFLLDLILIRTVANGSQGPLWLVLLAWLYREVTTYWCFLRGVLSREVNWRGKKFKLFFGGKAVRIPMPTDSIV